MLRNLPSAVFSLTLVLASLASQSAPAQDAVLAEFYGRGVHQYFAGNANQAFLHLSRAIDGGTRDPRAYYFRALAQLKMGYKDAANDDMQRGAALESADVNQFYPVGRSLERVQGASRMAIERYRSLARAETMQRQRQRDLIRYEERRRAEGEVLRGPVGGPAIQPPPVAPPAAAPRPAPAAVPGAAPALTAPSEPAPPAPPLPGEPALPAAADEDPFGEPPAGEPAPAAPPLPADEMPAADEDDPFGEPPAGEPAAVEPADEPAPAAEDDPFADDQK